MKTTIFKSAFLAVILAGAFTGCVNDDDYDTPDFNACTETDLVKNREVSEIAATSVVTLHENIVPGVSDVIEAYVTSSDIGGNFFKSISFQTLDGTKAFSIPVDAYSTFMNFEPGRKVLIKLDGLYTDIKHGGVRIGGLYANSSGGAEVGRLTQSQFLAAVKRSCTIVDEEALVQHVTVAQAMTDYYVNKLIQIDNVQFEESAINNTYYDENNQIGGATNYNLMDIEGNSVIFRTSGYSNFAARSVADGSGSIRGVMTKYLNDFQFLVRSESDINLTNPRFTPLLNESFSSASSFNAWINYSVTGAQTWAYSATFGNPGGMAKMSGYSGTNQVNEDWLISPVQDLSNLSSATLSFDNAYKFTGDPIVALVSNNYSGSGDPTLATWTILDPALSQGNYVYVNSGPLDISAFTGAGNQTVYVAFKYTSNTAGASTWEIDNVKIMP